jgi:predicted AAA+ superfamily ATPase
MVDPIFYPRCIQHSLSEALNDTPVVLISEPRQVGKTTLVEPFAQQGMRYLSLDDELTLTSARTDPVGLIRSLDRAVIDEVQRAPDLLLAIKKSVDDHRSPGRFLLTGSANLMFLPKVSDSLAGRMQTLSLHPLSQSELHGQVSNWIDQAFLGQLPQPQTPCVGRDLIDVVIRGGFPESIMRTDHKRRRVWLQQYIASILQRDVREVADIGKSSLLPRFLTALSQGASQQCNYTKLGGQLGLDGKTAAKYIAVFETLFWLQRVDSWSNNGSKGW